jgi:hypothetical protein
MKKRVAPLMRIAKSEEPPLQLGTTPIASNPDLLEAITVAPD